MKHALLAEDVRERVRRLPALPQVVQALDRAVRDPGTRLDTILALIGRESALTATALRLANSSFYGVSGRVLSLRDAVQILGLHALSSAVTTAAVAASFGSSPCRDFDHLGHWRHSLATALCAQRLAEPRGVDTCTAYTAGLLHDLGTLALATFYPAQLADTVEWAVANDVPRAVAERERLGMDHAALGGMIARHWRLAPCLATALAHHHDVPADNTDRLLDVLHLAGSIVHALDVTGIDDEGVPPLSPGVWERLAPSTDELQQLFALIETRVRHNDPAAG